MGERYSKLCSLPADLYAESSPLMISAGNLLKDNMTGKVLVQLKIRNIAPKTLKAATIVIHPQDAAGKAMEGDAKQKYLDLTAKTGEEFGQKTPILLPDESARGFSVEVEQVVFVDNSTWEEPNAAWEPLPTRESLGDKLGDAELLKQYRIRFGEHCVTAPQEHKDLWLCACGTWNREPACYFCGKNRSELLTLDLDALKADKDARLAEEKAAREAKEAEEREAARVRAEIMAQKTAKAKKAAKKAGLITLAAAVLALLVYGTVWHLIPYIRYSSADKALAEQRFDDAYGTFASLGDYRDSADKAAETIYQKGLYLKDGGAYPEAAAEFDKQPDYRDSAALAEFCRNEAAYLDAKALLDAGSYLEAAEAFSALGDYADSAEQVNVSYELFTQEMLGEVLPEGPDAVADRCRVLSEEWGNDELDRILQTAVIRHYLENGDPDSSLAFMNALYKSNQRIASSYQADHYDLFAELQTMISRWYLEQGDLESAFNCASRPEHTSITDVSILEERNAVLYQIGVTYYEKGNYYAAHRTFGIIWNYQDALQYYQRSNEMFNISKILDYINSENYSGAIEKYSNVDTSVLSTEERESFLKELYNTGKMLETRGQNGEDYRFAFAFYEFSQKGDYQNRMKACNDAYRNSKILFRVSGVIKRSDQTIAKADKDGELKQIEYQKVGDNLQFFLYFTKPIGKLVANQLPGYGYDIGMAAWNKTGDGGYVLFKLVPSSSDTNTVVTFSVSFDQLAKYKSGYYFTIYGPKSVVAFEYSDLNPLDLYGNNIWTN